MNLLFNSSIVNCFLDCKYSNIFKSINSDKIGIRTIPSKCKNNSYETGTIRTTGGGLSRFFDVQNQQFSHITCDNCGYTEFFKRRSGGLGNVLDMFLGG